jgi:hypothetical protein
MQDTDRINAGIAQQLVGRTHATGSFVSCEPRNGKITMTSQCSQCGGPHSGISLTNAAQAVKNPTARLIVCNHCKFIEPTAKALTFEDVIRIPERQRSAAQQRIVAEYENAERSAQQRAAKEAPVIAAREQANRAVKASLFESHERFLVALAHICVANSIDDARVREHENFLSWEQWVALSDEDRAATNHWIDLYWSNNQLASYGLR